jgi:CubicO group peptidase (beta-lactamase class C family)
MIRLLKKYPAAAWFALMCASLYFLPVPAFAAPDDEAIRAILKQRIDVDKRGVGIVVGIVNDKGMRIVSYGSAGNSRPLDGDTVFEIGSVTKTFTTLLLADMAVRGEVKLDDPVAKYLPAGVKMPAFGDKQVTLLDLATQRSGLPRMPDNFKPANPQNPFADYTVAQLYAFLSGHTLVRAPGEKYDYSNVGMGLLGHVLALRAGMDFEALVKTRILQPLGMDSTAATLTPAQKERFATGHNPALQPTSPWDIPALGGAGMLRSSAKDMLKYLAAQVGLTASPLSAAMQATQEKRFDAGSPAMDIGMGWHIQKNAGGQLTWHDGGTSGFRTYAGFNPATREGVIVLSNAGFDADDIGRHLLEPKYALAKFEPPREMKQIALAPEKFEPNVGEYQLTPTQKIVISREGEKFYGQAGTQPRFELKAESETHFFAGRGEVQIVFTKNEQGEVTRLVLKQAGREIPAARIK